MTRTHKAEPLAIDDRMQLVVAAYYEAIAAGDEVLAEGLGRAMDKGDIEAGLALLKEKKP